MVQYIYFVKCPCCEDEHFDMFDDAKNYAMGCLSKKPIITQTEVCRNDFGECTDSSDLGQVWSWEDMMKDMPEENMMTAFSKSETVDCTDDYFNCEFYELDAAPDNFERPVYNRLAPHEYEASVTEDIDFVNNWEYLDYGAKLTKEALYDLLVTRGRCVEIGIGDREHYDSRFSDGSRYSDSKLNITMNADGTFEAYEWDHSDDGDSTDGDFEFTSNSFDEFWNELVDYAPEYFIDKPNARKPIPADMSIESLVEEMEENEDMVECKVCEELFEKASCTKDPKRGWVCENCNSTSLVEGVQSIEEPIDNKLTLEEFDSDFTACPECGEEEAFDHSAGFCTCCGFSASVGSSKASRLEESANETPRYYFECSKKGDEYLSFEYQNLEIAAGYGVDPDSGWSTDEVECTLPYYTYDIKIDDIITALKKNNLIADDPDLTVPVNVKDDAIYNKVCDIVEQHKEFLFDYYEEDAASDAYYYQDDIWRDNPEWHPMYVDED